MKKYYFRKCDVCNKGMSKGILAEGSGSEYFCSEDCIKKDWDNTTFFITPAGNELNYSQFMDWIGEQDDNTLDKHVYEWFNGCAEWYLGDQWDVVFDIDGVGYNVDKVLEEEIIEGDE
jgi:hypothetical protein